MIRLRAVLGLLLCLGMTAAAFAQSSNSAVSGTVADPTGALIPGVTVKAENTGTGIVSSTVTNETGTYNFPSVQPGTYKVTAELPGFQTQIKNDVQVGTATQLRLNFTLTIGNLSTSVEVSIASDTLLAESAASVGTVLPEQKIRDLPIVGNNVLDLVNTMAGVQGTGDDTTFAGVSSQQINTVRDGLSVTDGRFNNGVFATTVLNPDLVGEVRVILAPVDAEMGRGNGQVQIQTRSGTNAYTGSAVWNIRNTALNSNTWTNNRNIDPTTGLWSPTVPNWENNHQYTVSFGGPIFKNKTFFFALWDQQINLRRQLITASVMTDTARQGIFRFFEGWNNGNAASTTTPTGTNPTTAVVDYLGNPLSPLTNPNSTAAYTGGLRCISVFGNRKTDGSPFTAADCPGGTAIINTGPWDSLRTGLDQSGYIQKVLGIMPAANYFATGDGLNTAGFRWTLRRHGAAGGANVTQGLDSGVDRKQLNLKVDHNFTSNHKLSGSWTIERNQTDSDTPNWPGGLSYVTSRYPQVFTLNLVSTLSSSLLNEARYGIRYNKAGVDAPFEIDSERDAALDWMLSSNGYNALVSPGAGAYAYGGTLNGFFNTNPGQYNGNTSYLHNFADTISWTHGKHAYKFGGEVRLTKTNGYNNTANGGVVFPPPTVQGGAGNNASPLNTPSQAGGLLPNTALLATPRGNAVNMLYFLAGSVNNVQQLYWIDDASDVANGRWEDVTTAPNGRKYRDTIENEFSAFVKDDWKLSKNWTLNLGLRYDYYGSPYIGSGFTSSAEGLGDGLWGAFRTVDNNPFQRWLTPGSLFLTGYGSNPAGGALRCELPACNPNLLTRTEFIGPKTPNPDKTAVPPDRNNFGPAIGFAWTMPWFGEGQTTVRGGYQITYGGGGRAVGGGFSNTTEFIIGNSPGANSVANLTNYITELNGAYLNLANIASFSPSLIPARPTAPALPGGSLPVYARANYSAYDPNYVTPYTQNFTLSVTRNVRRNLTVDMRYIGTVSRKQEGQINLNTNNIYHNTELFAAIDAARRGENPVLLDQLLAGLNINTNVPGYVAVGSPIAPNSPIMMTGAMALRRAQATNLANGDYLAVANFLGGNGTNIAGLSALPAGVSGIQGRVLRNGCDRLANGQSTVSATVSTPLRCFSEDYIFANPQLGATSTAGGFAALITNTGYSNYHSLQTQVTLRPTQGFSYQATYSLSKNLGIPVGTAAFTDPSNRQADYTYTDNDRRHDFRSNGTFELPIGPNKLFLGNSSGVLARLLERWQTSVIFNMTSGSRVNLTAGGGLYGNAVPDIAGPFDLSNAGVQWNAANNAAGNAHGGTYFGSPAPYVRVDDPMCSEVNYTDAMGFNLFTNGNCTIDALADARTGTVVLKNPRPGTRGNLGQNTIELPGSWSLDANLSKSFRLSESKALQIRVDATNVLNHPNPGTPNLALTGTNTPFGEIAAKGGQTRQFQGQLRLTF